MTNTTLTPIEISTVEFNLKGFQKYTKYAVNLIYEFNGKDAVSTAESENAFLDEAGNLIIKVNSVAGTEMTEFLFSSEDFRVVARH